MSQIVLAGCGGGGGGLSTAQFHSGLNALCATAAAFSRNLPRLQRSQHLSADELAFRANQEGMTFRAGVAKLTPPLGLSAADHTLIADLSSHPSVSSPSSVTPAAITKLEQYAHTLLRDYTALGAKGCQNDEQQALAGLQASG